MLVTVNVEYRVITDQSKSRVIGSESESRVFVIVIVKVE